MTALLHPDDLLFFNEVRDSMRRVAKDYELPLKSVTPFAMPEKGMADAKGDCTHDGHIRIVMRCAENGEWCDAPRTPEEVIGTAAHELAHLKHFDHSEAFHTFRLELLQAMRNQGQDHREKVIAKLVKMQASRDSEAAIGNSEAAEAFATAINRMLLENELHPSDLDYARATDHDPVIEVWVNFGAYSIETKKSRVAWQEALARIVAKAHLCTFLIRPGSNTIIFVGTKSHATVAEYAFGTLVPAAEKMSLKARGRYRDELRAIHGIAANHSLRGIKEGFGFREAWLDAFIHRIGERFDEARRSAVAEAPEGNTSTAILRLDGALAKAHRYIDEKFSGRRRGASALNGRKTDHAEGRARGTAAANAVILGRKGIVGTSNNRGLLR